jgi:hypothetical protein
MSRTTKSDQNELKSQVNDNWKTRTRGTNDSEYQLYCDLSGDLPLKTYEEWLNS